MDVSLIFGIIFTIILISVVLVFGGEQIASLFDLSGEAQVIKSIGNLESKVDEMYRLAENSGEEFRLSFSKDYKLCFFNSSNPQRHLSAGWDLDSTVLYKINQSRYNMWYFKGNSATGTGKAIPYMQIPTSKNFCSSGGSNVYIVNRGDFVEVEPI
jgi:hypothetical protein